MTIVKLNIAVIGVKSSDKNDLSRIYINGFSHQIDAQTISTREIQLFGHDVILNIIDLEITNLTAENLKSIQGIILVFDIDKPESFEELKKLFTKNKSSIGNKIVVAIAANKGHLRSSENTGTFVPVEQYKQIESEFNCTVFETSTETGENVENIFNFVAENILRREHLDKDNVEDIKECFIE